MADLPKLPLIVYNLKDRGRQFTGKERNFNLQRIASAINSQATQERVRLRNLIGYYGHKVRQLAGLEATESVVIGGKYNSVEPAIVTTYLKGHPDGRVEHQTEFLDNPEGWKAARAWSQKIGGFSSAIDEIKNEFWGFDYVLQPNYVGNSGFTLDDANGITYDSVAAEVRSEHERFYEAMLAKKDNLLSQALAALDSAEAEKEELYTLLTKKNKSDGIMLDGMGISPITISASKTQRILNDRDFFASQTKLPIPKHEDDRDPEAEAEYRRIQTRYGR